MLRNIISVSVVVFQGVNYNRRMDIVLSSVVGRSGVLLGLPMGFIVSYGRPGCAVGPDVYDEVIDVHTPDITAQRSL